MQQMAVLDLKGPVGIDTATANSLTVKYTGTNNNADAFAVYKDAEKLFRVRGSGRINLGPNAATNDPTFLFTNSSLSISDTDSSTNPKINLNGTDGSANFAGLVKVPNGTSDDRAEITPKWLFCK